MSRPSSLTRRTRALRRRVLARRRSIAAVSAAAAVAALLQATAAPPPRRTLVLTAARDLPAGAVVGAADLRKTPFDTDSVPAGVIDRAAAVLGRTTAGPVRTGEPITDVRLVTRSLLAGYPGLSAVPVRLGDAGVARLLRVGDRVEVLAADAEGRRAATVVSRDAPVLAIPRAVDDGSPATTGGALVVIGVPTEEVGSLAQASVTSFLSVALAPSA